MTQSTLWEIAMHNAGANVHSHLVISIYSMKMWRLMFTWEYTDDNA